MTRLCVCLAMVSGVESRCQHGLRRFLSALSLSILLATRTSVGGPADVSTPATGNSTQPPISGPLAASRNPNYFQDANGTPLILCGSHSWNTLQDWGTGGSVRPLDFDAFVHFLRNHEHNFTLLWFTELPKFHGLPTTERAP